MVYLTGTWGVQAKARHMQRYSTKEAVEKRRKKQRNIYASLKKRVFEKLGNKCNICSFDDIRALQVDHVNGDGNKERRKNISDTTLFKKILRDTSNRYQTLCANCNWIKRIEQREGNGGKQ